MNGKSREKQSVWSLHSTLSPMLARQDTILPQQNMQTMYCYKLH